MNEQERSELEQIKRRHSQLEQELLLLAKQLTRVESKLNAPEPIVATLRAPEPEAARPKTTEMPPPEAARKISQPPIIVQRRTPEPTPPVPPPIPTSIQPAAATAPRIAPAPAQAPPPRPAAPVVLQTRLHVPLDDKNFLKCSCKFCGGHIEFPGNTVGETVLCPHCGASTVLTNAPGPIPVPPPVPRAPEPAKDRSFEMRLGTYWLVRIGIVMLLTGLVFFGNYAYQNFIVRIGPAGKVSLLYLASAILLGAGAWWQRRAAKESLKNYAQVLLAGGLAAVYFTTYAAHHVDPLRVIGSPLLDGALLLAWAGFMVWIADRKKSEVLAWIAVGLAYYTSVITRVGSFTLYSNLVLTLAAVFFLVRNRWAALSFASLVATYVAYGYWRFFNGSHWQWATPEEGLWHGTYFLMAYWIVFTAAVFLSKHDKLSGMNRATFLTLNNSEFFVMFLLTMLQVHQGGFWKFSLGYGAVLLGLAELARRVLAAEPLAKNSYLTQGLLLVTVGLISNPHVAGLNLALLLGAESVVLLTLGSARKSLILEIGASVSGALAVGWGLDGLERNNWHGVYLGSALGGLMAFNAFWSHRRNPESKTSVRPAPAFFSLLALTCWLATTWYNSRPENFPLALAVEALALTLSIYVLRIRELALFGQGYLLLGQCVWLVHFALPGVTPPWWNPALMIALTLGLSHWWQRQKVLAEGTELKWLLQGLYALALIGVVYSWLEPRVGAPVWLALASLLAVGITAYGVFTRAWLLAVCGQIFLLISAGQFAVQLFQNKPEWYFPLAPIAALGLFSASTVGWFQRDAQAKETVRQPLLQIALLYRWAALVMSLWWVNEYIPARERIWVLALLGLLAFLGAGWRRNSEALLFSAAFSLSGLGLFWVPLHGATTVYWPNLLAILAWLGQQRAARHLPGRYNLDARVHGAMIVLGGLSLWLLLYRWLCQNASGFYLTASWSGLALVLFTCGMVLRERMYRWVGLGVLASALGRVFLFDVWKLETLYRILSFMVLGIVLLVLGFIYNKYQEKFKEWL